MDFFDQQDRARRNSRRLVVLFSIAVIAIFVALYAVTAPIFVAADFGEVPRSFDSPTWWWQPDLFFSLLAGHLLIVGVGSWLKIRSLSEGGGAVARMLGGREVQPNNATPEELRLLNVVEEMAIASGTPVPQVFVLDNEWGLNAFAAGYGLDDAAVAVTRGGLRAWNRDELQGVIAHEFSHILNGDMRLNIRMIGLISGLVTIAGIGLVLSRVGLRVVGFGGRGRGSSSRDGMPIALAILIVGAAVYVVGWVGVLAGRLIQSALSRQREFLADASAAQFTRNPHGLAMALRKVGGAPVGAHIENAHATETSHLFFGDALQRNFLGSFMASHPPLAERVRRLDPNFNGAFPPVDVGPSESDLALDGPDMGAALAASIAARGLAAHGHRRPPAAGLAPTSVSRQGSGTASPSATPTGASPVIATDPQAALATVGAPSPEHLRYAGRVREEIPAVLQDAAHHPLGAAGTVIALLIARDESVREEQLRRLSEEADAAVTGAVHTLLAPADVLPAHLRLPLVELSLPALRHLSVEQRQQLLLWLDRIGSLEKQLTLFRFAVRKLLRRRLGRDVRAQGMIDFHAMRPLAPDLALVLSVLARVGHDNPAEIEKAFRVAADRLFGLRGEPIALQPAERGTFLALDQALDRLAAAAPVIKRQVVDACAHCVLADGRVTVEEAELLRLIAELLAIAMPPFLPSGLADNTP